jgi:hypothetical protein
MKDGQQFPMSTMPGEWVDNVFAGRHGSRDDPFPRGLASAIPRSW